jgi:NhaP-type Na+/H+ or K+/H+ antiporter
LDDPAVIATLLLSVVALLLVLARAGSVPYPVVLFVGGTALGFLPGLPELTVNPDVLLLGLLPPLLFAAAAPSSLRELRDRARTVTLLSTVLVLLTMAAVAVVAHTAAGIGWQVAFVLGAVVSPTDPIAATAIASRLGVSSRLSGTLESEGLINDATSLVLYRVAVGAATTGAFSVLQAGWTFVWGAAFGVAFGLLVGQVLVWVLSRTSDPPVGVVATLLGAYLAYLPVEALGGSAVQLPSALRALGGRSTEALVGQAALVILTVVGMRFLWLFTAPYVVRAIDRRPAQRARRVGWRERVVTGWSGMRGAVSLAAALAIPTQVADRDLVIVLTYAVIAWTLVIQGLTLPALIRRLGVLEDGAESRAEAEGRAIAAEAALARLDSVRERLRSSTYDRVRTQFLYRQRRWELVAGEDAEERDRVEERSADYRDLVRDLVDHQRLAVRGLHEDGRLPSEALRRIERDLDLDHARMEE